MRLGIGELLVVLAIALIVFGPGKLPQLGDALGKGIRNFKKAASGIDPDGAGRSDAEKPRLTGGSAEASATGRDGGDEKA